MRIAWLAIVVGLAACASPDRDADGAAPPAPPPAAAAATPPNPSPVPERPTLAEILDLARETPRIRAAREAESRERGRMVQADLAPNPVAGVRTERIDPDDLGAGPDVWKFSLRNRFETAGKRGLRTEVASARVRESEAETRAEAFRVAAIAAGLHQRALAATALVAARREALTAAEGRLAIGRTLVDAGRLPRDSIPPLLARVGRLRIALADEEERGRLALRELEGVLAVRPGTFVRATGEPLLEADLPDPASDACRVEIEGAHPELLALAAAAGRARSATDHARSGAWPDVTAGAEIQSAPDMSGSREETFGLWVEVPLPVADRNQGEIAAAAAEERRVRALTAETAARLTSTYALAMEAIETRRANLEVFRDAVLPARERELSIAEAAHAGGRTDATAVLEARLVLAEAVVEVVRLEADLSVRVVEALALLGRDPETWAR